MSTVRWKRLLTWSTVSRDKFLFTWRLRPKLILTLIMLTASPSSIRRTTSHVACGRNLLHEYQLGLVRKTGRSRHEWNCLCLGYQGSPQSVERKFGGEGCRLDRHPKNAKPVLFFLSTFVFLKKNSNLVFFFVSIP